MLNDSDLQWHETTNVGEHTPPDAGDHADLSKGAFSYATKEIEVEEADFSVEINWLMGLRNSISELDAQDCVERPRLRRTCCLQHTAPIWTTNDEREGGRRGRGNGGRKRDVVVVCGLRPPGSTWTTLEA